MNPGQRGAAVRGAALGLAGALALGFLLDRLLLHGQAQSFDAVLYARSLWGAAHGSWHNSVVDKHALSVHAHLLSYLLVPLVYVMPAVQVLIVAQAAAFGVTIFAAQQAFDRACNELAGARRAVIALLCTAITVLGTPLLLNPFLFDARHDLLGVPLATLGLLRAREQRGFDARSLIYLVAAALAREEFAAVAAVALVFAPAEMRERGLSRRARWLWAAGLSAYLGGFLVFAHLQASSVSSHLAGSTHALSEQLLYRAKLLGVVLASAGGLVLLGWRFMYASVPGLVLLAVSSWQLENQLNFHYGMFAAPGLVLAAVAGFDRLRATRARLLPGLAVTSALAAAMYVGTAAAPGGAAFAASYFELGAASGSQPAVGWVQRVHAILAALPPQAGLAIPHNFAAPYADRETIWTTNRVRTARDQHRPLPLAIAHVGLLREDFAALGPYLRNQGFTLTQLVPGAFALLSRDAHAPPPWNAIRLPKACSPSEVSWPHAGLVLCNLWHEADGRAAIALVRRSPGSAPEAEPQLLIEHGSPRRATPFLLQGGLIGLRDMPVGAAVKLYSATSVPAAGVRLVLEQAGQRQPALVNGRELPALPVQLAAPDTTSPR